MPALLTVHTADGCVGRCDPRCYDARTKRCKCVCFGRNHGRGRRAAEENAADLARTWAECAARLGVRLDRVEVTQDALFPIEERPA